MIFHVANLQQIIYICNMLKIIFTGNLGRDAEIRETKEFRAINFSVGVKVSKEETKWLDCAMWRKSDQSTIIVDYLKKGTKVLIEGEPNAQEHNGKAYLKVRVSNVELLGGAPAPTQTQPIANDDIPF
jgi:single-strand DNA-binding protein